MDAAKNEEKSNASQLQISIDRISEADADKEKEYKDDQSPMVNADESTGLSRDV